MKKTSMNINELKKVIKESVKEAIKEERLNLYLSIIPYVSKKEQKEIEKLYGEPSKYDETKFKDMTKWIGE